MVEAWLHTIHFRSDRPMMDVYGYGHSSDGEYTIQNEDDSGSIVVPTDNVEMIEIDKEYEE